MDNLAHTLVGAALGRAVGDPKLPRAALLGAVAANAPDWAEFLVTPSGAVPVSPPANYLVYHRGITHSFLGAGLEIVALTVIVGLATAWWARTRGGTAPSWHWIASCVGISVLSHLYMDWQGSYGLRPLLPWSGRWDYADWVAIVDPFFWLVPLVALACGSRRHWAPALLIAAVGLPVTGLVIWGGGPTRVVALWVKLVCAALCVIGVVGWTGHWFGVAGRRRAAAFAVLGLGLYALGQGIASVPVKTHARRQARARFGEAAQWAALTVVGRPFDWERIAAHTDTVAGGDWALPRHLDNAWVQRAIHQTPDGRAMARFARFLAAEVDSSGRGVTVYLIDARFARMARRGWGVIAVTLE